jgi:hypothetical protein
MGAAAVPYQKDPGRIEGWRETGRVRCDKKQELEDIFSMSWMEHIVIRRRKPIIGNGNGKSSGKDKIAS